jgi:hypothetical protein
VASRLVETKQALTATEKTCHRQENEKQLGKEVTGTPLGIASDATWSTMTARIRRFLTGSALLDVPKRRHVMHESKTKSPKFLFCHTHVRICLLHTSRIRLQHIHATHKVNTGIIHNHTQFSRLLLNWGGKGPLAGTKLPAENAQLASDPSFSFATRMYDSTLHPDSTLHSGCPFDVHKMSRHSGHLPNLDVHKMSRHSGSRKAMSRLKVDRTRAPVGVKRAPMRPSRAQMGPREPPEQ